MSRSEHFDLGRGMIHDNHSSARVHPIGEDTYYLSNLVTNVDRRGLGHGREFMENLVATADAQGAHLGTHPGNDGLIGFYEKFGFEKSDREGPLFGRPYMHRTAR